jgi:FAD/FMN-containing dehydrogenase
MFPDAPGDTVAIGPLPAPSSTAPAVNVVCPVPPNTGLNAVVNPEICVISELLPDAAADNADLAAAAVLPPVPPDATGNADDSPVMVPPVIATALAF